MLRLCWSRSFRSSGSWGETTSLVRCLCWTYNHNPGHTISWDKPTQTILSNSIFPPGRAENAEIPTAYPQMHMHTYKRNTRNPHGKYCLWILVMLKPTSSACCAGGEEGIMTALTRELARLRIDATNNSSVVWKADGSWRKSWVSVHEDAARGCGEAETSWINISVRKSLLVRVERCLL